MTIDALGRRMPHKWGRYMTLEKHPDSWKENANCAGSPGLFHSSEHEEICLAIALCNSCDVTEECAEEQRFYQAPGVWAGVRWIPMSTAGGKRMKKDSRYS